MIVELDENEIKAACLMYFLDTYNIDSISNTKEDVSIKASNATGIILARIECRNED